jgi:DNA-binding transcriptional LysR family regulator
MIISSHVLLARLMARSRLRQWQLAQEIAALGSLQRAAEAIGMSQPAATHALADLETLLGMPLFERHAKGSRLTAAGVAVLPRVRQALQAIAECADIVSSMHAGASGVLRVGATGAAISGLLSRALPVFSERFPAVTLQVTQLEPRPLVRGLLEETLDIAVCRPPEPLPVETEFYPLLTDRYAIVCSPRHPLDGRTGATLAQLVKPLWLMPPTSSIAERDFHALWGGGPTPERLCWVESRLPMLMWSMLEQREALAFVPYNSVRQWVDSRTLTEVPGQWGPQLTAVGVLIRSERLQVRGPLTDLFDELRRCGGHVSPSAAV